MKSEYLNITTSELEAELARRKKIHRVWIGDDREIELNFDEMRILRDSIDQILIGEKVIVSRLSENPVKFKG